MGLQSVPICCFLHCLHSIPLALWPFVTIAQQRFWKGRENLQLQEANMGTIPCLEWGTFRCVFHSLCWEDDVENGRRQSPTRPSKFPWQVFPWMSLYSRIFSQTTCFTVGELLLRLQLRNNSQSASQASVLVLACCSWDPGNDSQHSKKWFTFTCASSWKREFKEHCASACRM